MQQLKHHFIPHAHNDHHAPVLHRKRHLVYSVFAIGIKALVICITLLLPLDVFVTPDALEAQLDAIIVETNRVRAKEGEGPLEKHTQLAVSAALKAADMRDNAYFAHTSPSGVGVADVIRLGGYRFEYAGENLAMGYSTAKDVVRAWKESPTHYKNLVHPVFQDMGVGVAVGSHGGVPVPYFVQHFGTPKGTDVSVLGMFIDDTEVMVLPQSRIFWKEVPGGIEIEPQIFVNRDVARITISQFSSDIVLTNAGAMYTTKYTLLTSKEALFEVILPVSIIIETTSGESIESIVPWFEPPILQPSLLDRYHMATGYVRDLLPLIIVSRVILLVGIAVLTLSILAHIVWSVHTKKHQITVESLLVLILLVSLLVV
jgi:uncharacterized protein YkwD